MVEISHIAKENRRPTLTEKKLAKFINTYSTVAQGQLSKKKI